MKGGLFLFKKAISYINNENGGLQQMTWVIGSAVVVALVIVGAMVYAPDTAENIWNRATNWITSQFGL